MNNTIAFLLGTVLIVLVSLWYLQNGDDDAL